MGVALKTLITEQKIQLSSISGKTLAIDAYNTLYQFLSIIRQRDGTPLKDAEGVITSHLSGLLYRTSNLVETGIKPVFVFDGIPHPLKIATLEKRKSVKKEAEREWQEALDAGDMDAALKHAKRTSRVDQQKVDDAKYLLQALGIPFVDAPGEGEAQASYMNMKGEVDAVATQDYDALLFGSRLLIRNVTITGKRKLPDKHVWVDISPAEIMLKNILEHYGINREQLVDIGIMIGTDFNEGIVGIGPKKALTLIQEHGNLSELMKKNLVAEIQHYDEVRKIFLEPAVEKHRPLRWKPADDNKVIEFLCERHQFSIDRVKNALEKYAKFAQTFNQTNLFEFS